MCAGQSENTNVMVKGAFFVKLWGEQPSFLLCFFPSCLSLFSRLGTEHWPLSLTLCFGESALCMRVARWLSIYVLKERSSCVVARPKAERTRRSKTSSISCCSCMRFTYKRIWSRLTINIRNSLKDRNCKDGILDWKYHFLFHKRVLIDGFVFLTQPNANFLRSAQQNNIFSKNPRFKSLATFGANELVN